MNNTIIFPSDHTIPFHSTSTMQGSGSTYCSNPSSINSDGHATYQGVGTMYASASPKPRKIEIYVPTTDINAPIGDALIPLLLMTILYTLVLRRRKTKVS